MKRGAVLAILVALLGLGCSRSPSLSDSLEASVVRLGGEVCGVDLFAGGAFVAADLVVTAAHPVAGAIGPVQVRLPTGAVGRGTVVALDPERDVAVLRVDGATGVPLELAPDTVPLDAVAAAIVDRDGRLSVSPVAISKRVLATSEDIYGEGDVARAALQLGIETEKGMSGSAVVDTEGRLLGIVFAAARKRPVSYAVSSGEIASVLASSDLDRPVATGRCR